MSDAFLASLKRYADATGNERDEYRWRAASVRHGRASVGDIGIKVGDTVRVREVADKWADDEWTGIVISMPMTDENGDRSCWRVRPLNRDSVSWRVRPCDELMPHGLALTDADIVASLVVEPSVPL